MRHCYTRNGLGSKLLNEMQFPFFWYLSHFVSFCLIFSRTDPQKLRENEGPAGHSGPKIKVSQSNIWKFHRLWRTEESHRGPSCLRQRAGTLATVFIGSASSTPAVI
jgi:hypothetical protein